MNYYNEHDPKAAAWLRELIGGGHIPNGIVDERSITDVSPDELSEYIQCRFFAGIGGWSLALQLAGWPASRPVWTGSCPCQPFSVAGQGKGGGDDRHLWPVLRRLIAFQRPERVFGEQVAQAIGFDWLDGVSADLEEEGYAVGAAVLGAHSVGAPHIRQRLFWVADSSGGRCKQRDAGVRVIPESRENRAIGGLADSNRDGLGSSSIGEFHHAEYHAEPRGELRGMGNADEQGRAGQPLGQLGTVHQGDWSTFDILPCTDGKARRVESGTFPLAYGVPGRVGLLRGYGNAIVPQVAAQFILAYLEAITPSPRRVTELKPRP